MSVELKPCPFCGGGEIKVGQPFTHKFCVYCDNSEGGCGAEGGLRASREEAIAAWNTRHDHSPDAGKMGEDAARYRWIVRRPKSKSPSTANGASNESRSPQPTQTRSLTLRASKQPGRARGVSPKP